MRTHADMITIVIDHSDELTKLARRGWSCKAQDGIDLVGLRLDSVSCDRDQDILLLL